jgi:hypothetical protein
MLLALFLTLSPAVAEEPVTRDATECAEDLNVQMTQILERLKSLPQAPLEPAPEEVPEKTPLEVAIESAVAEMAQPDTSSPDEATPE